MAGSVGITVEVCDWPPAAALVEASRLPVILAGGISPENVFDGIRRVSPAGIDSCTQTNARAPAAPSASGRTSTASAAYFTFCNEKRGHQNFDRKTPVMVYFTIQP